MLGEVILNPRDAEERDSTSFLVAPCCKELVRAIGQLRLSADLIVGEEFSSKILNFCGNEGRV